MKELDEIGKEEDMHSYQMCNKDHHVNSAFSNQNYYYSISDGFGVTAQEVQKNVFPVQFFFFNNTL